MVPPDAERGHIYNDFEWLDIRVRWGSTALAIIVAGMFIAQMARLAL